MRLGNPGQRFFVIDYETTGIDTVLSHPIEIGVIITDHNFSLIDTIAAFIRPPDGLAGFIETKSATGLNDLTWAANTLGAYRVHGITPDEINSENEPQGVFTPTEIGELIADTAEKHTVRSILPILVSDNIQFEWAFTKRLVEIAKRIWPFHYCGWDTSLLLEATGVGDPKPAHRALADAGLLHAAILKSLDRMRNQR